MRILALETSSELGSCALWQDGELIEKICPSGRSHSETLLPLVRELLAAADCRVAQLDGIAFGVGPGAFTGLRVACGAAQGLAVAADLPLLPVTSLAAMALQCPPGEVLSLLDARMSEVYFATYRVVDGACQSLSEIRVAAPTDIPLPTGHWLACGNAPKAYPALAQRLVQAGIVCQSDILPTAAAVARLAAPALLRGEGIDAALAAPLYVRNKVAKTVAERLAEGGKA